MTSGITIVNNYKEQAVEIDFKLIVSSIMLSGLRHLVTTTFYNAIILFNIQSIPLNRVKSALDGSDH